MRFMLAAAALIALTALVMLVADGSRATFTLPALSPVRMPQGSAGGASFVNEPFGSTQAVPFVVYPQRPAADVSVGGWNDFAMLAVAGAIVGGAVGYLTRSDRAVVRPRGGSPAMMPEMANGKMAFTNVAREWRCKWKDDGGGKATSKALVEIADLVDEYLPQLKALEGAEVNRSVCGGCLDFKLSTNVPLDTFGPWEEAGQPPEAEFLEKLKKIEGVSQVETQTMTFAAL
jgi:hypothetical protein